MRKKYFLFKCINYIQLYIVKMLVKNNNNKNNVLKIIIQIINNWIHFLYILYIGIIKININYIIMTTNWLGSKE